MIAIIKEIIQKQVAKNSLFNLVSRITVLIISMVFIAFISRKLDKTEFGIFALLTVFEGLIEMISGFGLPTSAIRLVPELKAKGEQKKVSDIIKLTIIYTSIASFIVTLLGIIGYQFLSLVFIKSTNYATSMIWILGIAFFYSIFDRIILIYQSLQLFIKMAFIFILTNVTTRLIAIILMIKGYGMSGIFFGFLLGTIGGVVIGVISLRKYIFSKYFGYPAMKYIKFSLPYYGQRWATFAFNQADQMLIAVMFTPEILAAYFIAKKIVSLATLVFTSLLEPVIPKLAEIKTKGISVFKDNMSKVYNFFVFLALCGVILIFINSKNFMYWLGGIKFSNEYLLVNVLAISVFGYGLYSLYKIGVYLYEKPLEVFKISLYAGISNIIFGIVFGLLFGLIGFAVSQSLGFIIGIIIIQHKYRERRSTYYTQRDIVYIFMIVIGFFSGYIFNKYFIPLGNNFSQLIGSFIINLVFFLAVYIFYVQKKNLFARS